MRPSEIGRERYNLCPADYRIQLYAGHFLLAEDTSSVSPEPANWKTALLTFSSDASHPALTDKLTIKIWNTSPCNELNIDNVRLTAAPRLN
jgi:hypothetical protein